MQTHLESIPQGEPTSVLHLIQREANALSLIRTKNNQLQTANNILFQILPEQLRMHCSVSNINFQTVSINVSSAAWTDQLRYRQDKILAAFRKKELTANVNQIKIRIIPPTQHTTDKKRNKKISMSPNTGDLIRDTAKAIKSSKLQASLLKLADNATMSLLKRER